MATAVKRKLSGSTDGMGILVVQTSTQGDTIHTAIDGTTDGTYDEIWLYASNNYTGDVLLTIEFGNTAPENNIIITLPAKTGLTLVVAGLILQNSAVISAFASVASVITITGEVNRITD